MKCQVNRAELVEELTHLVGIVDTRSTIPCLSEVKLEVIKDRLHMAGTDLEVSLKTSIEVQDDGVLDVGPGAILVNASKVLEVAKVCGSDVLDIEVTDGEVEIRSGDAVFDLRGLPAEEFPQIATVDSEAVEVPFPLFCEVAGSVVFSAGARTGTLDIGAIYFEMREGGFLAAATDGHRLALSEVEADVFGLPEAWNREEVEGRKERGVLIPLKALGRLQKFSAPWPAEVRRTEMHLSFTSGHRELICRRVEASFPDYDRVISFGKGATSVEVDRADFAAVVSRAKVLASDSKKSKAFRLEAKEGKFLFLSKNPDTGTYRETYAVDWHGPDIEIGLDPQYLLDILGATEADRMALELKDENTPLLARPVDGDYKRQVLMMSPIRL